MKKSILSIVLILSALWINLAIADSVGIVDIDMPDKEVTNYLVYATDGVVYEISPDNAELQALAFKALKSKRLVEIEVRPKKNKEAIESVNQRELIGNIKFISKKLFYKTKYSEEKIFNPDPSLQNSYVTNFESEDTLNYYFNTMRRDTRGRSQCYNRAHVWSWELYRQFYQGQRIQTGKIWLFFTKKFIRSVRYKWWFHIAPYMNLDSNPMVLDRKFTKAPMKIDGWADQIMGQDNTCQEVYKYSDYSENQFTADCYYIKSSVFYWQPWQIEQLEEDGTQRLEWVYSELRVAYKNAIGFFTSVPEL